MAHLFMIRGKSAIMDKPILSVRLRVAEDTIIVKTTFVNKL